jgi:hypothetical protein
MTRQRMLEIAVALHQQDPINWIRRFREFNRETEPMRIPLRIEQDIITQLNRFGNGSRRLKSEL